jgi:hypothetical protein
MLADKRDKVLTCLNVRAAMFDDCSCDYTVQFEAPLAN